MKRYLDLLNEVLTHGTDRPDRTGVGTRSVFGGQVQFDLAQGFPLLTTKKIHFKSVIIELLWFLRGETNVRWLQENKVSIWDEWADENGELGPVYGKQWRRWTVKNGQEVDQIAEALDLIQNDPSSRRIVVSAWNVSDLKEMALMPCHCLFQFQVADGKLNCHMYQRSADIFLGVPFNIASFSLLTLMMAQVSGLAPGKYVHSFGDLHLYSNHFDQARLQLSRTPRSLPHLHLNPARKNIDDFTLEDFTLENYDPHPTISAPIAV